MKKLFGKFENWQSNIEIKIKKMENEIKLLRSEIDEIKTSKSDKSHSHLTLDVIGRQIK
jgi:hypothetical protein